MTSTVLATPTSPEVEERIQAAVKSIWGFESLRPLQYQAIEAGLAQRDSLVVLPTGGGKSLCYQVPPLIAGQLDVVISPLIALMRDQVEGLRQNGYPAAAIHSNLTEEERQEVWRGLGENRFRLLFVSPERIVQPDFASYLQGQQVRAISIDEAHCISQWGHDFRPEYRQLASLRERFPGISMHAFTATATPRVRQDVIERLELSSPTVLVGTFDRPNLTYRVVPSVDVRAQALEAIRRHPGEAAIVYCISRKDTERMADYLASQGVDAAAYHAGLEAEERTRIQDSFSAESLDVVCATVAFGMGIDRSDVRCVLHAAMPKSIEHYQQESGRAGRDSLEAECVLFYSAGDAIRWEGLMQRSAASAELSPEVLAASSEQLNAMRSYCSIARCRHRMLSEHFGQAYPSEDCGACDVCLDEILAMPESTPIAQKILSCVYRMDQRWGVGAVVEVLRGAQSAQVRQRGHDELSTFGILSEVPAKSLTQLVYQLVDLGLLERHGVDYPVLRLAEASMPVLRGETEVRLVQPAVSVRKSKASAESWEGVDRELFEQLRTLRRGLAAERNVPAYVVFGDAVLRGMAAARPSSLDAMHRLSGVGEKKLADFGDQFLQAIAEYCREQGVAVDQPIPRPSVSAAKSTPKRAAKSSRGSGRRAEAMKMFATGASVEAVSQATGRAESTVWGYLAQWVTENPEESVAPWISQETRDQVLQAARDEGGGYLKPIFLALDSAVPYEQIRVALASADPTNES
ncbi:MAG: DNA helicase RecQ [Thermoanaerobaculia bacterium]|nr:DNA helicase RecQ [Thermoanaerobaculia bacterium]